MREYQKDPAHPPKQEYIRRLIDKAFGFHADENGSSSRDSSPIARLIETDNLRTGGARGRRSPVPKDLPLAEN